MLFDVHVHVAELGRDAGTDRFVYGRSNFYVRMFVRQLGMTRQALAHADANEEVKRRLIQWAEKSSIDRFVLLAMDGVYGDDGRLDAQNTQWIVENDFVSQLAKSHPKFLFGASVHPYRTDAMETLERAIAAGACLVKWIPSSQRIRLDDPRCIPIYERMAQARMPLLVHTGNEHATSRGLNHWNDPALLAHPLKRGVKVIAAHCGTRLFLHERCGFQTFARMAKEHEHLYGDLAAFGVPTRISALRKLQKDPELLSKIVYGSDFPTVTMARWFVFSIGMKAAREVMREVNPLERPYLLMKKMNVPFFVFERAGTVLKVGGA